ncbi:MAG: hypothetical protein KatS3mg051_1914 [Anaerolineae bacterium]|nr:MAG: hypothetical protein KatS3mg051_1914 [Anaerolineae bacterium]
MEGLSWVQVVLAFVAGGGVQALIGYLVQHRRDREQTDVERLRMLHEQAMRALESRVSLLQLDNERLREIEQKASDLEREVQRLRYQVLMLESAHQDLPLPMWLKDRDGRMLALNTEYEREFLIPRGYTRDDYIGQYDSAVWPEGIANIFADNDRYVVRTGDVLHTIEPVPDAEGVPRDWIIIKYPRRVSGVVVGVGGIAIPAGIEARADGS